MKPPRLARLWVRLLAPAQLRHGILDDLDEIAAAQPTRHAAYWSYWRETLRGTPQLIRWRLEPAVRALAFEHLIRDARYALRSVWREPTFAIAATLTLALGIGATTTVFSVVDAEIWKPLPFPNPHELVKVLPRVGARAAGVPISGAELLEWRAGIPAFSGVAADGLVSRQTLQLDTAQSVLVSQVTANYFDVLARPVLAGRTFTASDASGPGIAVINDRVWRRLFDGAPDIVGRTVQLDSRPVTIAGVVQANDSMGADADVFFAIDERAPAFHDRGHAQFFGAIGRLRPDASLEIARAQVDALAARLKTERPAEQAGRSVLIEDLSAFYTGPTWRPLYFLLGASIVVLLLGAVNVAALVLARAFGRRREFALRGALGGTRFALARQLLAEGASVALPAAAVGVVAAHWAVGALAGQLPDDMLLRGSQIPIDARVWIFAVAITALTAVVFMLAPLVAARRMNLTSALAAGGRAGRPAGEGRARVILLASQLALTMVLLSGAAIFLKSFVTLSRVPLGFDPEHLLAIRVPLGGPRYAGEGAVHDFAQRLRAASQAIPGVGDVAIGSTSPLGSGPMVNFLIPERPRPEPGNEPRAIIRAVTPAYFRTVGIAVRRGRAFTDADAAGAPRVAIVNEHVASQIGGGDSVIGRTIDLLPGRAAWTRRPGALEIVGVAANIKEVGLNEVQFGGIYVPLAQMTPVSLEVIVRTVVPPSVVAGTLRERVATLDPAVPVGAVVTFEQRVERALRPERFNTLLIAGFAAAGVLLACVGIYGAVAYTIQTRTRELGVRLALGAQPSRLISAAVGQAARIGVIGAALGLVTTLALAVLIGDAWYLVPGSHNGLLYGVATTDPWMLASAFAGITIVAAIAAAIPARRISRVDPVRALRSE